MSSTAESLLPPTEKGPAWKIATLFPLQGAWDELEYLWVTRDTNRLVELTNGHVEVLAMPTMEHQVIVAFLHGLLMSFVSQRELGRVLFAPLRIRLRQGMIREPDLVMMFKEHSDRMGNECWEGADLVMEVISDDAESRRRDLVTKRQEYAEAGIPEYWIVDPRAEQITVLKLSGAAYAVHGEFAAAAQATSALLAGFSADVAAVFDAARAGGQ